MKTAKERLQALARAAILECKDNPNKAFAALDAAIIEKNSAALERELCSVYRTVALRALLATHFHELRAEGRIAPLSQHDNDDVGEDAHPSSWAQERVKGIQGKVEAERENYLNTFKVNGEPIGDCTPEIVLEQASRREKDVRFMRMMANGVPPGHKIREFVTEEEAASFWDKAQEEPKGEKLLFSYTDNPHWAQAWRWMIKGIKTKDELAQAKARVEEILATEPETHADDVELDALARAIKEHEDDQ